MVWDRGGSQDDPRLSHAGASYRGTQLTGAAPDFRLVDHRGNAVALSDFRGKVVVLAFMDTRCDETCPLTAAELRMAHRTLQELTDEVVFMGVNVNVNFNGRRDAEAFTEKFNLDEIPSWHFLTGSRERLAPVWAAYSIEVEASEGEEDFDHTPGIYIIDQDGSRRWYISTPLIEEGLVEAWTGPRVGEILTARVGELAGT